MTFIVKRLARLAAPLFFALSPALAAESESLAGLRMECDTCHGVNGVSAVPDQTPSIAGRSERYLLQQLQAFQTGKRPHETMLIMGQKLSDQEMRALARYYSRAKR
jgi:cytochrome c553